MNFFSTIVEEMGKGNFSFLILVFSILQTILMSITFSYTYYQTHKYKCKH